MTLAGTGAGHVRPDGAWTRWLTSSALPLWSTAGYDPERQLFHERLSWVGAPVEMGALRLMVQARQIATYCRADLDGLYKASAQAIVCLERVERLFLRVDDQPGWVFSLASNDEPADHTRDLYAHAFILFAYAWAIGVHDNAHYRLIARQTVEDIKLIFRADNGGYKDAVPPVDTLRRQNPHMHLLEAYLALFETTGDEFYLQEARELVELALDRLIEPRSGLLLEFFREDWTAVEPYGQNRVEPGHLFEWAWLLYEHQRHIGPAETGARNFSGIIETLFQSGLLHGCDAGDGLVFDAMTENGLVVEQSTRIWPQTELLRLLCRRDAMQMKDPVNLYDMGKKFLDRYAPVSLNGGWIDRMDASGKVLVDYMPASSLYHIYGAGRELSHIEKNRR